MLYDRQSQQLSVQQIDDQTVEAAECPTCGRPLRDDLPEPSNDRGRPSSAGFEEGSHFVHKNYFRLLSESQRSSPRGSGPSSFRPSFAPAALRSGRSRDVSGAQDPPSGAEFVSSEPFEPAREGISASAFDRGYFKRNFTELRVLGKGGNGVVLLVEHIKDRLNLGQYACKRIPVGNDRGWLGKVLVEVQLLQKLRAENLVAYHWVWLEDHQPSEFAPSIPCLWILQEYCDGGDLHSYIVGPASEQQSTAEKLKQRMRRKSKGEAEAPEDLRSPSKLTLKEIFSFFKDITSGLHYLHSAGYLHRDLKPSNCLLRNKLNRMTVLISDFGEVQVAGAKRGSTGATGTISYCAPEVLQYAAADGKYGDFTTKSDIFSLGMIVYFMCFARLPYVNADGLDEDSEDLDLLRAEISKWTGFDEHLRARSDLPDQLYQYLKGLLSVKPHERPSTDEILKDIKVGTGLGDSAVFVEETSPRVSSVEPPRQRPKSQGTQQTSRPGLSSISKRRSEDTVQRVSPRRRESYTAVRSHTGSRPTSPADGSMVMRPRTIALPAPKADQTPQQSPRLMLPPPDHSSRTALAIAAVNPTTIKPIKVLIFFGKIVSMVMPCSPYAVKSWVLYPLLGLSVLDLGFLGPQMRVSALLMVAHIAAVVLARQHGRLCEGSAMSWDQI